MSRLLFVRNVRYPTYQDTNILQLWVLGLEKGTGSQFFSLGKVYISNLSLLLSLEPFEKFVVGGKWWMVGGSLK